MSPQKFHKKFSAAALLVILALSWSILPARADAGVTGEPAAAQAPASTPGGLPADQPDFTGCTRVNVPVQNAAYEQQVLDLVNLERAKIGVPPLKRNTDLDYAGRYHAKDMLDDGYFAHDSYDGSTMVCSWSARISKFYTGWSYLGENIAAGYPDPEDVMNGWMNSPGHKANILNANYREIGVGYVYGSSGYRSYWVQDFGARGGVYPLIINRDAAQTSTPEVGLYIYSPSPSGVEMRLRNDSDAWGPWQAYQPEVSWTLKKINGMRTVSVELRSGGSTYASSDTIEAVNLALTPALGNLPDSVTFIYDQSQAQLTPSQYTLQPLNTGSADALNWQAAAADAWINPQNGSGSTPASTFSFTPSGGVLQSLGEKTTTLTVTATGMTGVLNSPKAIQVRLVVVEALDKRIFLPAVTQ